MINGWFPKKQAATAVGFLSAGSPLGGAVAGPIVGYLALAFGWRPAFMIIFAIGIVWMIAWFFIAANSPEKHKKVSQEELKLINKIEEEEVALENNRKSNSSLAGLLFETADYSGNGLCLLLLQLYSVFLSQLVPVLSGTTAPSGY